jgi:epoxyqueuosine reductase
VTAALASRVKAAARDLGFDACGIAPARLPDTAGDRLREWVEAGHHGTMGWMAERLAARVSPDGLWPEAASAIALAMTMAPETDPLADLARTDRGNIATYARRRDYHDVIKGRLKLLAGKIAAWPEAGEARFKVFVDTAPLLEKPLAARAGLGWQGKHTVLLSRDHGNWLMLGFVLTTLELPADPPAEERCGTCRRCLDICPTGAFPAPHVLDSRLCISYLTIEHKGPVPRRLRPAFGNRVFGCDDCLAVCPWNKFAGETREAKARVAERLALPPLSDLLGLDDTAFRALFSGTPVKRTGRDRFMRNALIAAGNSGLPALAPQALALLGDASPLVRGAAVWALARLLPASGFRALADARAMAETDPEVRSEWQAELEVTG